MNPLIQLVNSLRNMSVDAGKFIRVNNAGTSFTLDNIEAVVEAINNSSAYVNAREIDGKTINEFISLVATELDAHSHENKTVLDGITQQLVEAWTAKQDALGFTPENSANKAAVNGYASLDAEGKVPISQLPSIAKETIIVPDYAGRDELTPYVGMFVMVIDADDDTPGEQTHLYVCADTNPVEWLLVTKINTTDYTLAWENIENGPAVTPSQIDDAVAKAHTHANKATIDKFGLDAHENLTFDGELVALGSASNGVLVSEVLTAAADNTTSLAVSNNFVHTEDKILGVYYGGIRLLESVDYNFSGATNNITLTWSLLTNEWIEIEYQKFSDAA